jgi:D-sedoheptulose 7-phosphate isomerase
MKLNKNFLQGLIDDHINLIRQIDDNCLNEILSISHIAVKALAEGRTIYWCGNGGSAADCQHLAAELVGRFCHDRKPLSSISLTTDTSVISCIANDYNFDDIFSRQLVALATKGDILVGISTSGMSTNVNKAFLTARQMGLTTIALLGKGGGEARSIVDIPIVVPSNSTARIQEVHIFIGHIFCSLIEQELGLV